MGKSDAHKGGSKAKKKVKNKDSKATSLKKGKKDSSTPQKSKSGGLKKRPDAE